MLNSQALELEGPRDITANKADKKIAIRFERIQLPPKTAIFSVVHLRLHPRVARKPDTLGPSGLILRSEAVEN